MAYENLNVNKLRGSLNILDNISANKNALKKVSSSLSASSWSENSRVRVKNAIDDMSDVYEQIEKYISNCKIACNYIEQYKELDVQNKQYQNKVSNNQRQIKNADSEDDTSNLESKVNQYKNNISKNNSKKTILKEKINNLIN